MNEIQKSLFEAMETFSNAATKNSKSTLTVQGIIEEIVDEGLKTYKVKYMGSSFIAYTTASVVFKVGDPVYVLIPEGDFSQTKIILGTTNPTGEIYVEDTEVINKYYPISDNLITYSGDIIKLSSYEETYSDDIAITEYSDFNNMFISYLAKYNTFSFSALFKTSLALSQQNSGNYGLSLKFPIFRLDDAGAGEKVEDWTTITLDVGRMLGNPYKLSEWTPQTVIFTLDKDMEYDMNRLPQFSYFCYGFNQDPTKVETKDVLIKDLNLAVLDALSAEDYDGYCLTLKASEGEYFTDNLSPVKTITPTFRIKGKPTAITESSCQMYWFKEDLTVQYGEESFSAFGGVGWKSLNTKGNNTTFSLKVNKEDFVSESKYKCVIVYKEVQLSAIITLKNLSASNYVELSSATGSNVYIKNIGKVKFKVITHTEGITDKEDNLSKITYRWLRFNKNSQVVNEYLDKIIMSAETALIDSNFVAEFEFPVSYIEDLNEFVCSVYYDESLELGTDSLVISTAEDTRPQLAILNGDRLFKYDVNGNSPFSVNYLGPVSSMINAVPALSYRLVKDNGIELTSDEYKHVKSTWFIPKDSMFTYSDSSAYDPTTNCYVIEKYGNEPVEYGIAKKFDFKKANETIQLQIDFLGTVLNAFTNIVFTKEGQLGTNGTAYSAQIVWGGASRDTSLPYGQINEHGKEQKLKFLYNVDSGKLLYCQCNEDAVRYKEWLDDSFKPLFTRVWEDDIEINSYSVKFSMFDAKNTNPCFSVIAEADGKSARVIRNATDIILDAGSAYVNIVQAEITLDEVTLAGTPQKIYCYYPIELTIVNDNAVGILEISQGYSEVMYATDGTNPQYDSSRPFVATLDEEIVIPTEVTWTASPHFTYSDDSIHLSSFVPKPKNKYDDGNTLSYVKVLSADGNALHINPIILYYNRYGMNNFNAWDGNKVEVNDGYLLAPQMGAGIKDAENAFTGVVMGQKNITDETTSTTTAQLGIFGYNKGNQTFKLSSNNGSAIFGSSNGGQIVVDPTQDRALLYSSNLFNSEKKWLDTNTGLPVQSAYNAIDKMLQDGTKSTNGYLNEAGMVIDLTTPGIAFGSGKFRVDSEGNLYAGRTDDGIEINGAESYIRFNKDIGRIYSGKHNSLDSKANGFFLNNTGLSIGAKFFVTNDGILKVGPRKSGVESISEADRNCWVINGSEYKYVRDKAGYLIPLNAIPIQVPKGAFPIMYPKGATHILNEDGTPKRNERYNYVYEEDAEGNILCDRKQPDGTIVSNTGVGAIIYETISEYDNRIKYERNKYEEIIYEQDSEGNIYCNRMQLDQFQREIEVENTTKGRIIYTDEIMLGEDNQTLYKRNEKGNIIWIEGGVSTTAILDSNGEYILDSNGAPIGDDYAGIMGEYESEEEIVYLTEENPYSYIGQGLDRFASAIYRTNPSRSVYIGSDGISLGRYFSVNENGNLVARSGTFDDVTIDGCPSDTISVVTDVSLQAIVTNGNILNLTLSYGCVDIVTCPASDREEKGMTLPPVVLPIGGSDAAILYKVATYEQVTDVLPNF